MFGLGELGEGLGDGDAYGFALGGGDEPFGFFEVLECSSDMGAAAVEEDMGGLDGGVTGALLETVIDYWRSVSGADDGSSNR